LLAGEATIGYYNNFAFARIKINGTLDSSFGTNGLQAFKLAHYMAVARDILLDNDSIMVAGGTRDANYDFALLRVDATGALVSSFGTGGEVIGYYNSGRTLSVNAIAVQSVNGENKILYAGQVVKEYGYTDFGLTRFNADGSLDTSFGDQGIVVTDIGYGGNHDNAFAVSVQNINGVDKIVVAGVSLGSEYNDPSVAICRYNADGTPDESFGYLGQSTNWGFIASSMAVQNDGKVIVAGQSFSYDPAPPDFAMIRFKTDGSVDAAFGNNGVVTTDFSGYEDAATSITIQTGGKIILAGKAMNAGGTSDFAVARYGGTGAPDQGFGTNGKVVVDFNSNDDGASSVAVQADGKIVVAGWETVVNGSTYTNFALARFTSKGKPDLDFGNQGKVTTDFDGYDDAVTGLAIQNDGKIIAAGYTEKRPASTGPQTDFAIARYDINGAPDTTFGADKSGKVVTDAGFSEEIKACAWKNDRLYVGGNAVTIAGFAFPSYFGIAGVDKTSTISLPQLTISDVTVDEGDTAHLTVSIDQVSSSDITINYTTEDVTASGRGKNQDYKAGRGSVVIAAGQTTADISIATNPDNLTQEGSETFNVNLALSNQMAVLVSVGDNVGVVTINDIIPTVIAGAPADESIDNKTGADALSVKAFPNPSNNYFTLQLQSKLNTTVSLILMDASGRVVETMHGISANGTVNIGYSYSPGVYYVQVVQGSEKLTLKLIKQK
ncbi:MAG TPA: T9SS type A sorting domain-containing protein, partial [Chitinophagaceae bacterium]